MVAVRNIQKYINKCIAKCLRFFLLVYQIILSPILHAFSISTVGGGCRFYPTCSEYTKQVINKYGISFKSIITIINRLIRCQPIRIFKSKKNAGYDPVK